MVCLSIVNLSYSFLKEILEADSVVENPSLFEEDPHNSFEQGKWTSLLHFCLIPNNIYNKSLLLSMCIT
jgi:hypothetical protein